MLVGQHIQIPRAYQPNYAFAVSCGFPYHLDGVYKDQVLAREPFKNEPSLDTPARDVFELLKNGFLHGARAGTDLRNHINTIGTYPQETAKKEALVRAFNDGMQAFYDALAQKVTQIAEANQIQALGKPDTEGLKNALNFMVPVGLERRHLRHLDLSGMMFLNLVLKNVHFTGSVLSTTTFAHCDLRATKIAQMVASHFKLDQCAIDKGLSETWVRIAGGRRATPSKEQFAEARKHGLAAIAQVLAISTGEGLSFVKMQDIAAALAVFPKGYGPIGLHYRRMDISHTRNIAHNIPSARPDTTLAPYIPDMAVPDAIPLETALANGRNRLAAARRGRYK